MPFACAFCGSTKRPRGREHVFADWLNSIGLEAGQVEVHTGWLNRVARRWTTEGFTATVRAVCDDCNHGWLSQLEAAAKPVLTPLILGQPMELSVDDQRLIATWSCKTALVAMLSSSDEQRAQGYGVPPTEYQALYATREHPEPLPGSQYWIGTYVGERPPGAVRITPLGIELEGMPPPDDPSAYSLTIMVGPLLVHGVRFTTPIAAAGRRYPRNVYLRQDAFGAQVNAWLATAFAPVRLSDTVDQIMAGQHAHTDRPAAQAAMARIEEASIKMGRYRAALDAGGDPEEIGKWISDAKAQRLAAEAELRQATTSTDTLTREQVQARIEECADVAQGLGNAEAAEVARAYQKLGLRLT